MSVGRFEGNQVFLTECASPCDEELKIVLKCLGSTWASATEITGTSPLLVTVHMLTGTFLIVLV